MFPKTQFEAIILWMTVVIGMYFAWFMGRQHAQLSLDTAATPHDDHQPVADVADVTDVTDVSSEGDVLEVTPEIQKMSDFCDSCAEANNQCSSVCTSQTTIDTCQNLKGYVNMPYLPCPLEEDGISSYSMFRVDPHRGVGSRSDNSGL